MKVKNNYNECLTNLACSVRKYFEFRNNENIPTLVAFNLSSA